MSDEVTRGVATSHILLQEANQIKEVDYYNFTEKNSVDGLIRFQNSDFLELLNSNQRMLMHFNLQCGKHQIGKIYGLVRITRQGYYISQSDYKEPILDASNLIRAKCVYVKDFVSYNVLSEKDFIYSFKDIKNVEDLKKTIIKRYSISMPNLNKSQILDMGVGLTLLELI